jgi:hypothetical protein
MQSLNRILFGLLILSLGFVWNAEGQKSGRPNVILIYTDDQGAIDLNCLELPIWLHRIWINW